MPIPRAATAGIAALTTLALVWLAAGLPAGAFFSGDSGVKLIAARGHSYYHTLRDKLGWAGNIYRK